MRFVACPTMDMFHALMLSVVAQVRQEGLKYADFQIFRAITRGVIALLTSDASISFAFRDRIFVLDMERVGAQLLWQV
jgi:hypothetical protein